MKAVPEKVYFSPYQEIVFGKLNGRNALFLDGEVQYIEGKPLIDYHSKLARGLKYHPNPKVVAILGGGDGILANFIHRQNPKVKIYLLELDPMMIKVFSKDPRGRRVNGDIFNKNVVKVVIGDAYKTIDMFKSKFDIIFQDFPDMNKATKKLYSENMLRKIHRALKPGGIFSMYGGGTVILPPYYYKYFQLIDKAHIDIPEFGVGAIIFYGRKR